MKLYIEWKVRKTRERVIGFREGMIGTALMRKIAVKAFLDRRRPGERRSQDRGCAGRLSAFPSPWKFDEPHFRLICAVIMYCWLSCSN